MGWMDDFQMRIDQAGDKLQDRLSTDIDNYIANDIVDDFSRVGQVAMGNLSLEDLKNGKTGAPPPIAAPASAPAMSFAISPMILIALMGVGAFLMFSGKKG